MPVVRVSRRLIVLATAVCALLAGCASSPGDLRIMVPTEVGGGYDLTARTLAAAMTSGAGGATAAGPTVFDLPGGGGSAALARLRADAGDPRLTMVMGFGLVGALAAEGRGLGAVTPIARLVTEPEILAVPAASPFRTVADLVAAWRADPGAVVVAGVSEPGGPDGVLARRLAAAVGVPADAVRYRTLRGDTLLPALLSGEVDVAATGLGETVGQVDAGTVRPLAVSSPARSPRLDAPTLSESGVDLALENWRGVIAPPGLAPADRDELVALVADARGSDEWREAVDRFGWTPAPLDGDAFGAFLDAETAALTPR